MKRKKIIIFFMLALLIISGGVVACKHGHRACSFDEFDLAAATNRIASRLDLSESQKSDLDQLTLEIADRVKLMRTDRENRQSEWADLVRQESIDQRIVDERITAKLDQVKALADFASERLIAFHRTLTPEQKEIVATRIEEHKSGRCHF